MIPARETDADPLPFAAARFHRGLGECERLLARHLAAAVQRFGAAALEVIDLPSLAAPALPGAGVRVSDQLRVAATLLWTREVEAAGLPGFVDALAEGVVSGRALLPITTGADALARYWQGRHGRFTAAERSAVYERLFGRSGEVVHPFVRGMDALCALLSELGRAPDPGAAAGLQARVGVAATELADHLSRAGAGIAAYAGREIVAHVKAALRVLRDRDVALSLGGGGPWTLVERHAPALLGRAVDPRLHLDRAAAGLTIVGWIAAAADHLDDGTLRADPRGPEVEAAELWRAAAERR
jgi:hypothetical protein